MNKLERQQEQRSAWRWLLAGFGLWLLIPISFGAFYLCVELTGVTFSVESGYALMLGGMLLAIAAGIAGTACIVAGAILQVSSSSRPG